MNLLVQLFLSLSAAAAARAFHDWNYAERGPGHWRYLYPGCGLPMQSPIDIWGSDTEYNRRLAPISQRFFDFKPTDVTVSNNGAYLVWEFIGWVLPHGTAGLQGNFEATGMRYGGVLVAGYGVGAHWMFKLIERKVLQLFFYCC